MRLFIAVDLSDSMKKALVGTMHDLKKQGTGGSYVPAQNLHMTLAFIGEYNDPEEVIRVMKTIPVEKSRLSLSGFGYFGDVLWAGIKGNQKIKKYAADLRKALKDASIPCDDEKFQPHVTLIRGVKGKRLQTLALPEADMTVTKVSLMKSSVKDGKRAYQELFAVR